MCVEQLVGRHVEYAERIEEILHISGFCKGLSTRERVDLDGNEREMLFRAGEILKSLVQVQVNSETGD
jgi:hypothetical protein